MERRTKKKLPFLSPERATPRALDALRKEGISSKTVKAYARTIIPFSQFVNDIRHARKDELEKGTSVIGNFLGYKVKDLIYAVPMAIKIVGSGGASIIPEVEKGARIESKKYDIDFDEAVKAGKQAKEFYDKTKKVKEQKS